MSIGLNKKQIENSQLGLPSLLDRGTRGEAVIAIFDVGKTNKKLLLFDEHYRIVQEESIQLPEIKDEEDFPCEDVQALTQWVRQSFQRVTSHPDLMVKAVNFSAYGASFVHLDKKGAVCTPLYNYLKPYPKELQQQFYHTYGGEQAISQQTASPVLGSLNSGMQLYRIKYEQPDVFANISYSLHLPQYLSYSISNKAGTDITSVGCHTNLWDFQKNDYHEWVQKEGLMEKLAPMCPCEETTNTFYNSKSLSVGTGLHDSSAALIPYLASFQEPFVLLSTGTWCISLNPFNDTLLTNEELQQDCLCYLSYEGKPVKASRLFAGYEHEQQVKRLAAHFNKAIDYYQVVDLNVDWLPDVEAIQQLAKHATSKNADLIKQSLFTQRDLSDYASFEEAYHQLMLDIVTQQVVSTQLVLQGTAVKRIFVDGGFSKNPLYMYLVAAAFPEIEVYAASMAQATAMGAALAIHASWNTKPLPNNIIELKYYSVPHSV